MGLDVVLQSRGGCAGRKMGCSMGFVTGYVNAADESRGRERKENPGCCGIWIVSVVVKSRQLLSRLRLSCEVEAARSDASGHLSPIRIDTRNTRNTRNT